MQIRTDIYLNQLALGIEPMEEGFAWFQQLSAEDKRGVLRRLVYFIAQSGAVGSDAMPAIELSKLKPTLTPCRILVAASASDALGSGAIRSAASKLAALPDSEVEKSFSLLLALLGISGTRQRNLRHDETKWWHSDLSDPKVIEQLLSQGRS
jgi:hypothetical protein